MQKPICIIGTGYVGMASAIGLAELGSDVVGYDVLPDRIAGLQRGAAPYREARIDELLRKNLGRGRMRFTSDHADAIRGAGLILISVGTPASDDGAADLRGLWRVRAPARPKRLERVRRRRAAFDGTARHER